MGYFFLVISQKVSCLLPKCLTVKIVTLEKYVLLYASKIIYCRQRAILD